MPAARAETGVGRRCGDRCVPSAAGKTDRPAIARGDLERARRGHMQVRQAPVVPWCASADIDPFGSARCQQDLRWLSRLQCGHCGGLSSARAIDETNDMAMCHRRFHLGGVSDLGRLPMARKYRTRSAPHPTGPPRMMRPEAIVVRNPSEWHRGIAGDHARRMATPSGRPRRHWQPRSVVSRRTLNGLRHGKPVEHDDASYRRLHP